MIVFDIFMRAIPSLNLRNIIKNEFWKVQNVVHHNTKVLFCNVLNAHIKVSEFDFDKFFCC